MRLVQLEGKWINTDQACVVRPEPDSQVEYRTEVVLTNQVVRLKMTPAEAVVLLEREPT